MTVNDKEFEELISVKEVSEIVSRLAKVVNQDFSGKNPLFIVMLNGAFMFAADFLRKITVSKVSIVSFLVKPEALQREIHIDYIGKKIEKRFVVGYGLDYDGFGRNLDAVYVVK